MVSHNTAQDSKEVGPTPPELYTSSSDVETSTRSVNDLERAKSGSIYFSSTLSFPREILFVTVVCCAQLTTQAGLGHVLGILKVIAEDFGIESAAQESWLIAAYSLTVGSFILISGRLGDIFGYKTMIIIGYLWYSLWSLVCGLSIYRDSFMFTFASKFIPQMHVLRSTTTNVLLDQGLFRALGHQSCFQMAWLCSARLIRTAAGNTWSSPYSGHVHQVAA